MSLKDEYIINEENSRESYLEQDSKYDNEISTNKTHYDNQIQKLQDRIQKLTNSTSADPNLLWANIRECAQLCNKAGEYYLKVNHDSLGKEHFDKARNLVDTIPQKEMRTSEWKALKISIYRNVSQYYSKCGKNEKALKHLRKILPLQIELEKANIILPGAESLYINIADLAFKLKDFSECSKYCEMGVKFLEQQLNIPQGQLFSEAASSKNSLSNDDPKVQVVRSRKYIALSYCSYLLGKSLLQEGTSTHTQQAIPYLKKAYLISKQYIGANDKITKSYKKKYETVADSIQSGQAPEQSTVKANRDASATHRRAGSEQLITKNHMKSLSVATTPRFDEVSPSVYVFKSRTDGQKSELNSARDKSTTNVVQPQIHNRLLSATTRNQNRPVLGTSGSQASLSSFANLGSNFPSQKVLTDRHHYSQSAIPAEFLNRHSSKFTIENNDLMVFESQMPSGLPTPKAKSRGKEMHKVGSIYSSQTTIGRRDSQQTPVSFPENFAKFFNNDQVITSREPLTASTSIYTNRHQLLSKKHSQASLTRPETQRKVSPTPREFVPGLEFSMGRRSASLAALYKKEQEASQQKQEPLKGAKNIMKEILAKETLNSTLNFLTARPQTEISSKSISSGMFKFPSSVSRPQTATRRLDLSIATGKAQTIEKPTHRRPMSAAYQNTNNIQFDSSARANNNLRLQIPSINIQKAGSFTPGQPFMPSHSPISGSPPGDMSGSFSDVMQEENARNSGVFIQAGAYTDRQQAPVARHNGIEIDLSTSRTEEIDKFIDMEQIRKGTRTHTHVSRVNDARTPSSIRGPEDYSYNNARGPNKKLSKELVIFLKHSTRQDTQMLNDDNHQNARKSHINPPGDKNLTQHSDHQYNEPAPHESVMDRESMLSPELKGAGGDTLTFQKISPEKPENVPSKFKFVRDISEFRRIEEEAASRIQKNWRRKHRKSMWGIERMHSHVTDEKSIPEISRQETPAGLSVFIKAVMDSKEPTATEHGTSGDNIYKRDGEVEFQTYGSRTYFGKADANERKRSKSVNLERKKDLASELDISNSSIKTMKSLSRDVRPPTIPQRHASLNSPRMQNIQSPRLSVNFPIGQNTQSPRLPISQTPHPAQIQSPRLANIQSPRPSVQNLPSMQIPKLANVHSPKIVNLHSPKSFFDRAWTAHNAANFFHKITIVKNALSELKHFDLKFYKQIQGMTSFWSVKFKGIKEVDGHFELHISLSNEKIMYNIQKPIELKSAELFMFYYSVWPIVQEAVTFNIPEQSPPKKYMDQRTDIESLETLILIEDLKTEKQYRRLFGVEEASIRKLLARISRYLRLSTFRFRKKTGYVFCNNTENPDGYVVRKNREELALHRQKISNTLKKLSTGIVYVNFSFEYEEFSKRESMVRSEISLPEQKPQPVKPKGFKSLYGSNANSVEDVDNNTSIKLQNSHAVESSNSLSEVDEDTTIRGVHSAIPVSSKKEPPSTQKKISMPKRVQTSGNLTALLNPKAKNKKLRSAASSRILLEETPKQPMRRSAAEKAPPIAFEPSNKEPEFYRNPFLKNEILLQLVLKSDNEFLVGSMAINYCESVTEELHMTESKIDFEFEAEKNGTLWVSKLSVDSKNLFKMISSKVAVDLKSFVINEGFTAFQKKCLIKYFQEALVVEQSRLQLKKINGPSQFDASKKKLAITISDFNNFVKSTNRHRYIIFDAHEDYQTIQAQQRNTKRHGAYVGNSRQAAHEQFKPTRLALGTKKIPTQEDSEDEVMSPQLIPTSHIRILTPEDPKYGEHLVGEFDIVKTEGVEWLTYYNEMRCISNNRYYINIRHSSNVISIRLEFVKTLDGEEIHINMYEAFNQTVNVAVVKDKRTQERIITILQMKGNSVIRDELFLGILAFDRTLVGRKLAINKKAALGRSNRKFDITPNNIAQILITNPDESLPKYGLEVNRIFKKGTIKFLGNCYITITTYRVTNGQCDNFTCLKFEITPFDSKTKMYKFLLNSKDLEYYFNILYPDIDPHKNLKILQTIISMFELKRQKLYTTIELPIKYHSSLPNSSCEYSLRNSIVQNVRPSSTGSKAVYGRFLEPKLSERRLIVQKIRKVQGQYLIFTIQKHFILDYWTISIYNPKTCRKFIASLYFSDIINMTPTFLDKICPSSLKQIAKERSVMLDYSRFCIHYHKHQVDRQEHLSHSIIDASMNVSGYDRRMVSQEIAGTLNFITHDRSRKEMNQTMSKDNENLVELAGGKFNFMEIKFWENIIEAIDIRNVSKKNSIVKIDEFRGVLREVAFRDIIRTSRTEEVMIEVFLDNYRNKFDVLEPTDPIPDVYIQNNIIFIRMTSIHKMSTHNNKFNLQQAIELYEKDSTIEKVPLLNAQKKLTLEKMILICNFLVFKMKTWSNSESGGRKMSVNRQVLLPWTNFGLKLNCNFEVQLRIDDQHMFISKFLIYRNVLSISPLQMVSIVYYERKDYFMMYLYDMDKSWILKKKIKMREVTAFIPYAKQMLKLELYEDLGTRIYKTFRNTLMIHSFINNKQTS